MKKPVQKPEVDTTGHAWDGIEELNNPLPRWWVWAFLGTIIWGIGYSVVYPAWPMIGRATEGLWGWSAREAVVEEIAAAEAANADIKAALVAADLTTIRNDAALFTFAQNAGAAVFRTNCATCHGAGAGGVMGAGYPNLLDDDWLWGGDIGSVVTTVRHGIRNTSDADARYSEMPAFGRDEWLPPEDIHALVEHVLAISGQDHDAALAATGATLFADNCASCHMEDGSGNREMGAPKLTDAIWLYGADRTSVYETIFNARFGVMPAWQPRLSEDEIRAVAVYVHALGGGE